METSVAKALSYTCAACRGRFTSTTSMAEADDEARELFGLDSSDPTAALVCDDCFGQILTDLPDQA